jgi:hypothetical protein
MAKEFQYDPLPPEVRVTVIEAWVSGGAESLLSK